MTDENTNQWVWGTNDNYDLFLHKLKDHLFETGKIDKDTKWTFTKYAILRLLYDHGDEIIEGIAYTPEQLIELIDYHRKLLSKFQKRLKDLASSKEEVTKEILDGIEFDEDEDENEE